MSETLAPDGLPLVPERSCGTCNACCIALTIKEPTLQKPSGIRCRHNRPDNRCAIYADRPETCRTFHCGWRHLKWVREPLRPDRSGVLIRLRGQISRATGATKLGVVFTLLNADALRAEGLAESVAAAVAAEVPVWLNIPGPPGYTSAEVRINEVLAGPVRERNKAAVLGVLRRLRKIGLKGEKERIRLDPEMPAAPDAAAVAAG
jgi:hypothetical protein